MLGPKKFADNPTAATELKKNGTEHVGIDQDGVAKKMAVEVLMTKANVGLGNVPDVTTNNQTPTYSVAAALAALVSGETLTLALGKIAKGIESVIAQLDGKSAYRGTLLESAFDIDGLLLSGFYTAPANAVNNPTALEIFTIIHINSDAGATNALQIAIGTSSLKIYFRKKNTTWYAWSTGVSSAELGYVAGLTSAAQTQLNSLAGTGRTTENIKANADAIALKLDASALLATPSATPLDTNALSEKYIVGKLAENQLYSYEKYLELKAKADAMTLEIQASRAELYNGYRIFHFGATDIIGKGTKSDYSAIDVSATVQDGKLTMEQKGLTIRNLVTNGDFASGTTGWTGSNAVVSVSTKILSITGNGTSTFPRALQSNISSYVAGGKIFVSGRARVTNSDCLSMKIWIVVTGCADVIVTIKDSPVANTWYEFAGVATLLSGGTSTVGIRILHTYADAATSNNKVMEVDGNYGVSAYNLTAHGLSTITDTAILAQLLPYVDGTKNVGKMGVLVRGVNQCPTDTASWEQGLIDTSTGADSASTTNIRTKAGVYYPILASSVMSFSQLTGYTLYALFYDSSRTFISSDSGTNKTVPATAKYVRWRLYHASTLITPSSVNTLQPMANLGATALPYAPYSAQHIFLPAIGNSLPNGVADSIKTVADGWERTKRVSDETSLSGASFASYVTSYTNVDVVLTTAIALAKAGTTGANGMLSLFNSAGTQRPEVTQANIDLVASVGSYYYHTDKTIAIIVAKSAYADIAAARTGLGTMKVYYELLTPVVTKYSLPVPTSGKTIHRFAGEEKISLYGTGLTFDENVLSVISAFKFVAGVMSDITSLAVISGTGVTFSGVASTDVVFVRVEHSVARPLGVMEHVPTVSNTASRLAQLESASTVNTVVGYEAIIDVANGATTTLPAGGTFRWEVLTYGSSIGGARIGTAAGGATLTATGNLSVKIRRLS